MRSIFFQILLILTLLPFTRCAIGPVSGLLYTRSRFAGEFNPANDVPAEAGGMGCTHQILGLFAFGDSGAGSIAKKNHITRIAIIDHSTINVFQILYSRYCTIVVGSREEQ